MRVFNSRPFHFDSSDNLLTTNDYTCTGTQRCWDGKTFKQQADASHNIEKGPLALTAQNYPSVTSFVFTSCEWNGCSANLGGAISTSIRSIELEVTKCQFLSCSSSGLYGGAIYAHFSSNIAVKNIFFHNCKSKGKNGNGDGGGAIFLDEISTQILISASDFVHCTANVDGGAVNIWNTYTNSNSPAIKDCHFVQCTITNSQLHEGVALLL